MKKIVCGCFGTIYYAQILKNGMMSSENRVDVTDDALLAVLQSLMCETEYIHQGFYGYQYDVRLYFTFNEEYALVLKYKKK